MKVRLAIAVAVLALGFTGPLLAQAPDTPPAQDQPTAVFTGTVVSSGADSLVIRSDDGTERTFVVDTSSTLPTGLTAGARVSVRYHTLDGGRFHAASVSSSSAPRADDPMDAGAPTDPGTRTGTDPAAPTAGDTSDTLPDTASNMALLALAGVVALATGLGLRALGRGAV